MTQHGVIPPRFQGAHEGPRPATTKFDGMWYMPIRCVPREKITTQGKLLVAFDALVIGTVTGQAPRFGKIIHGREQATAKVECATERLKPNVHWAVIDDLNVS